MADVPQVADSEARRIVDMARKAVAEEVQRAVVLSSGLDPADTLKVQIAHIRTALTRGFVIHGDERLPTVDLVKRAMRRLNDSEEELLTMRHRMSLIRDLAAEWDVHDPDGQRIRAILDGREG